MAKSRGRNVEPDIGARRALAALRILFGWVFLLNGLAKVFGWNRFRIGPLVANLINRPTARSILDFETNQNPDHRRYGIAAVNWVARFALDHWAFFQWFSTVVEVVAGVLLLIGVASRLGALLALGQTGFLSLVYLSNNRWLPEPFLELVPLVILVLVPAGRVWGLGGRVNNRLLQ